MATCTACKAQVTAGAAHCSGCGRKLVWPAAKAKRPVKLSRGSIIALGVIAVVIIVVAVTASFASNGGGSGARLGTGPWAGAAQHLGSLSNEYQVAKDGGDAVKMLNVQQQINAACLADAQELTPDQSTAHGDVQALCATIGITVP